MKFANKWLDQEKLNRAADRLSISNASYVFLYSSWPATVLSVKIVSRNIRYKIPSPLLRYRKSIFLVASYIFFSTTLRDSVTSFSFVKVGIGSSFNVSIKEIKRENIIIYNLPVILSSVSESDETL